MHRFRASLRRVRGCALPVALLCGALRAAAFSVELEAAMAHTAFVDGEPLTLTLTVRNLGGSPLIVDDYGEHRRNTVRIYLKAGEDGFLRAREGLPFGAFMAMPGESATVHADLRDWFPVAKEGRFHAQVVVQRDAQVATSRRLVFDVVRGIEIGAITRPLPEYDTLGRRYTLLYWPREQFEVLFLRVDEVPSGRRLGVARLGNVLRFYDPVVEFDPAGTLSVLHQSSRNLFVRTVLRTDRDTLEVVERERLIDPNQAAFARAAMLQRQAAVLEQAQAREEGDDVTTRRTPPRENRRRPATGGRRTWR